MIQELTRNTLIGQFAQTLHDAQTGRRARPGVKRIAEAKRSSLHGDCLPRRGRTGRAIRTGFVEFG